MRDVRVSFATVMALVVAVVKDPYVASALLAVCLATFGAYL